MAKKLFSAKDLRVTKVQNSQVMKNIMKDKVMAKILDKTSEKKELLEKIQKFGGSKQGVRKALGELYHGSGDHLSRGEVAKLRDRMGSMGKGRLGRIITPGKENSISERGVEPESVGPRGRTSYALEKPEEVVMYEPGKVSQSYFNARGKNQSRTVERKIGESPVKFNAVATSSISSNPAEKKNTNTPISFPSDHVRKTEDRPNGLGGLSRPKNGYASLAVNRILQGMLFIAIFVFFYVWLFELDWFFLSFLISVITYFALFYLTRKIRELINNIMDKEDILLFKQ